MSTLFEFAARLQRAGAGEITLILILKVTLILAIARLALMALTRASAATKHVIATTALFAVVALPFFSALLPSWNVALLGAAQEARETIGVTGDDEAPAGVTTLGTAATLARATGVSDRPFTFASRFMRVLRQSWQGLVLLGLAAGALLFFGQMLAGLLAVWLVARNAEEITDDEALLALDRAHDQLALSRAVRLLRSSRISVPVVWGIRKPMLLLPADSASWPPERLRVVLLHELAHLKRLDGVTLLVTRIAVAAYWFHPLAWSVERAGRSECERACDDLVLASGTKPSDYAEHLLSIAKNLPRFDPFRAVTLAMSRRSQLEGRLLSILQADVRRRVFSARGVAMACLLALVVVVPISAFRIIAAPAPEENRRAKNNDVQYAKTNSPSNSASASRSDSEITVVPDVDALTDYFLTKVVKMERQPKNGREWYERGMELHHQDRYDEAIAAFKQSVAAGYRVDASKYNIACGYAVMDDRESALRWLSEAVEAGYDDVGHISSDSDLDPVRTDPRFRSIVGKSNEEAEEAVERVAETQRDFERLRKHGSKDADEWYATGLNLLRLRKFEDSIAAFGEAIRTGEKVSSSMYNIACAQSLMGNHRAAIEALEKAVENGFDDRNKMLNDPDLRLIRGDAKFKELTQIAHDLQLRPDAHDKGRWFWDHHEDWEQISEEHRRMTERYPNQGRAWFNLGYSSLQAENIGQAIDAFQHALKLNYRPGTTSYNIACAYARQDDKDNAFAWLNKARQSKFDLCDYLEDDEDLDNLRRDPRYRALRESLRAEKRARERDEDREEHDDTE